MTGTQTVATVRFYPRPAARASAPWRSMAGQYPFDLDVGKRLALELGNPDHARLHRIDAFLEFVVVQVDLLAGDVRKLENISGQPQGTCRGLIPVDR